MTKMHFIALAETIRQHNAGATKAEAFSPEAIYALAIFCQSQNPSFDRERWLRYIQTGKTGRKLKEGV